MKKSLLIGLLAVGSVRAAPPDVETVFAQFWRASTPIEAVKAADAIIASGVGFDDALRRFRTGRPYAADVPTGIVRLSHQRDGLEFPHALDVPANYDPSRKYQVRLYLHGGVGQPGNAPRGNGIGALAGAEQIYVLPSGWSAAEWWSDRQLDNLRWILDRVKRTYNVDENRVVVSGVSDGGTGAYYVAMRDTTPFASFLPLNGALAVLRGVGPDVIGELFPNNVLNKPFFIVNGGRDPLYPTALVEPYINHMIRSGVVVDYRPQPDAVHNTAWWPHVKEAYETFVLEHPRNPFPDTLTWESDLSPNTNRAHWLVIDQLASPQAGVEPLPDLNNFGDGARLRGSRLFRHDAPSGRVDLRRDGNTVTAVTRSVAAFTILLAPDVFDFSKPIKVVTDGHTVFDGMVSRSVTTLAKWAGYDNDRTALVAAELKVQRSR